jgi:hypothetical protein
VEGQGYTCLLYVNPHVTKLKELTVINLLPLLFGTGTIFAAKTMKTSALYVKRVPKLNYSINTSALAVFAAQHARQSPCAQPHPAITRILSTQQLPPRELQQPRSSICRTSTLAGRAVTVGAPLRT